MAAGLTEPTSVGTGTVIRPGTVRRYAREAGFSSVTVLPIEHDFWRFYRLDPWPERAPLGYAVVGLIAENTTPGMGTR